MPPTTVRSGRSEKDMVTRRADEGRGIALAYAQLALASLLLASAGSVPVLGGDGITQAPRTTRTSPEDKDKQPPGRDEIGDGTKTVPAVLSTEVECSAPPTPGAIVIIGLADPVPAGTTVRWTQVEGPAVAIEDPTTPRLKFTIPAGARSLGFLVAIGEGRGRRTVRVNIPVEVDVGRKLTGALSADAGDDQLGFAGRRITLRGSSSREGVAFRWFQMGGPRIDRTLQDRSYFSFSPTIPGVYRFGLVVAVRNSGPLPEVSEPDEVVVTVGESPAVLGVAPVGLGGRVVSPAAIDSAMRATGGEDGRTLLNQVAEVFDTISQRVPLYDSFDYLTSEMMRRLDSVIPRDPGARQAWSQGIFTPLTQHMIGEMASVGLDLRFPQAQQQELTAAQKEKLQKLLAAYAREFSSRTEAR